MSLYVLPENQKLLWNTMGKFNLFQNMKKTNLEKTNLWFQTVIGGFYDSVENKQLTKEDLRTLNKNTISLMIKKLKEEHSFKPLSSVNNFDNNSIQENTVFSKDYSIDSNQNETRSFISEKKQNELNNEFQSRQKEYESFFKKPNVEEIDFREKDIEDKPIENMDELLQMQMKEREYDIQPINNENEVEIDTIDLGEDKKKVSWDPNIESFSKLDNLEKKMDEFMLAVQDQINSLRNEIEFMKNNNITKKEENITTIMSRLNNIDTIKENSQLTEFT